MQLVKKIVYLLFLVVLIAPLAFAKSSMKVPAVDAGGKGVLTNITADVKPGEGRVFVDIFPFFSIETQQSSRAAAAAAAALAKTDKGKHDFFYEIHANAEVVDGPSGGAALGVLTYGELAGKKPRGDLTATGGINADGSISKVGGIFEKAQASAQVGLTVFLVPSGQAVQDGVDLTTYAPEKWGLQVIEVRTLAEAIKYAFTEEGSALEHTARTLPQVEVRKIVLGRNTAPLERIAEKVIADAEKAVEALEKTSLLYNASKRSLNSSKYLLAQGYSYSAANAAFLTKISAQANALSGQTRDQLKQRLSALEERGRKVKATSKTPAGMEWAVAAELRLYWAIDRLAETRDRADVAPPAQIAQGIAAAENWLDSFDEFAAVAKALAANAQSNESELRYRPEAARAISEAASLLETTPDSEAAFHLRTARKAFQNGAYATAAIDAVFARAFARATIENIEKTPDEVLREIIANESALQKLEGAWAQLYFSHALYSVTEWNRTGDASDLLNAVKLQQLGQEIDAAFKQLRLLAGSAQPLPPLPEASDSRKPPVIGPSEPLNISISQIPSRQPAFDFRLLALAGLVLILAAVLGLAYALKRRGELIKKPAGTLLAEARDKLEKLDALLIEGRLSEENYGRLRRKYEARLKQIGVELEAEEKQAQAQQPVKKRKAKRNGRRKRGKPIEWKKAR